MKDILKLRPTDMAGLTFDCRCGEKHSVDIDKIIIGKNVAPRVVEVASDFRDKNVFLMSDNNTYKILGEKIEALLSDGGFNYKSFMFETKHPLVPDEKAIGRLLVEMPMDAGLIIAVGSGTINDMARILSSKTGAPYIIVCTAPSMDGYASTVSPLIIEGAKQTYEAVYPLAIIADTGILKAAPMEMIHAGFGDILGKYTALTDWTLSKELNNEYYCETSVEIMKSAVKKCVDNMEAIAKRDEKSIEYILEALILSGVAMGMVGNSRPASGAEHHMSHYWEMDAIAKGNDHPLHGNQVGVATVVMASIYEMMKDKIPQACQPPQPEEIKNMLKTIGACDNPADLGIDRNLFRNSIIHARKIRARYTILQLAAELGLLEDFAEILTKRFYG